MSYYEVDALIAADDLVVGFGSFLTGLPIAVALIWIVSVGKRRHLMEPMPPRPEEQPHLPKGGAVHEVSEFREPDGFPADGHRLFPYELGAISTHRSADQHRRRWTPGHSGGFGSGGFN